MFCLFFKSTISAQQISTLSLKNLKFQDNTLKCANLNWRKGKFELWVSQIWNKTKQKNLSMTKQYFGNDKSGNLSYDQAKFELWLNKYWIWTK